MRNGKPTLKKLRTDMLGRFDVMERNVSRRFLLMGRNFSRQVALMEQDFSRQVLEMRKTFSRDIHGLKERVKDVIEFIADMDQEIKDHKRDPQAHQ